MKTPKHSAWGFPFSRDRKLNMTQAHNIEPIPGANLRDAVQIQLLAGPSYSEVATLLLQDALKKLYPALDLNPYATVVAQPGWALVDGIVVELPTHYESLTNMLVSQMEEVDPVVLIEGQHFLTRLPIAAPELHLPVRIDQIGNLINELIPVMLPAFQEQQLKYWNASAGNAGPRWRELSQTLQKLWDVTQIDGWSTAECGMARQLFLYPDLKSRKEKGLSDSHAYLIDIDEVDGDDVKRLNENSMVVLIGQIDSKEVILAYSMRNGYERFDSRDALGQAIPGLVANTARRNLQWQLYEPAGNIFDQKACGLIDMQIQIISSTDFLENTPSDEGEQPDANGQPPDKNPGEVWFQSHAPGWLKAASMSDQVMFAQHMKNLATLSTAHAGKTYADDIPSIKHYALTALKTQMQAEHADASTLDLEKFEVVIRSPVVWGTFTVPWKIETSRFSLVELALQNLIALPIGDKTVRSIDGKNLPQWMTVSYIEKLIAQVDIGRVYPELIKQTLLSDPVESARRENLYTSQLRIQLPMLALENKILGVGNIDEKGYRYICALMEPEETDRNVDGQPVVLRKLAFVSKQLTGATQDVVANMFVIGPKDSDTGPCLLYRPLLEPQLCQYPSESNLLYAIKQTPALRQSVLAWLPDSVRNQYSRYVFSGPLPSPWVIVDFVTAPYTSLLDSAPVSLSDKAEGADFLKVLFKANADALVELADRQSVSNSEGRWETFKQAGWLIFNLVLPYLGTTAGTAVWLWQILDDIETLATGDETFDSQAKWEAFIDLLMNMAMAISAHAIEQVRKNKSSRLTEAPDLELELEHLKNPQPTIKKLEPLTNTDLPVEHYDVIHSSGALLGQSAESAKLLETFSIVKPQSPGSVKTEGTFKGLYEEGGNWYANVAGQWFKVTIEGEQVLIVDAKVSTRMGPPLTRDEHGRWTIDTRLRLRSGGAKGARQKVIADAKQLCIQKLAALNLFEEKKPENQLLLTMEAKALNEASGPLKETRRDAYVATLKTQRERYEEALEILLNWPVYQARPDAPRRRMSYLGAQITFTFEEMDMLAERITPILRKALDMSTSGVEAVEEHHVDTAHRMVDASENMIERLAYMETRFSKLKQLGREGYELIREHRRKMPVYAGDDLRLIQLDMYRHLCLTLDSVNTMPEGWAEVNQLVNNVVVSFQSLRDAMAERSVIRLDEQIDIYGSLTEQFGAIEHHVEYITNEYKDSLRPAALVRLGKQISATKKIAANKLARALDERSRRRFAASPYEERPAPRKKFIRARFWGLVSGEPRLSKMMEETDWLDVKNPFTDKIIATFHRKETGEWVPHINAGDPLDQASEIVPPLATSVTKGKNLIDGLAVFNTQIQERITKRNATPAGIGMILDAHASRLEKIGISINKALTRTSNETVGISIGERNAAESLRLELLKASKALYGQSFNTVLSVVKRSPPTMSDVIWLKDRNLISIKKQISRQRKKGPLHGYLDRYEIKDLTDRKTLWYADFHYSTDWVPAHAYLSARLKTPKQIKLEPVAHAARGLSQRQLINQYRSEIAVDQAKQVFFSSQS
jgi:hypothetical protein